MKIPRSVIGLFVLLGIYLALTLTTYKHFGVTADEGLDYKGGKALLYYFKHGHNPTDPGVSVRQTPTESTYFRAHLALYNLVNGKGYYEWFHLLNLLTASLIFVAIYCFLYREYKSVLVSLLGALGLLFLPRFAGDLPGNEKDVPFAVFYTISLLLIYVLNKTNVRNYLKFGLLAIAFGLSMALRPLGITLYFLYFVHEFVFTQNKSVRTFLLITCNTILIFMLSYLLLLPLWPYLATHLPFGLINLFRSSVDFEYWNNTIFFNGQFLTKEFRPQSYLPIWIFITTPEFILTPFLISPIVLVLKKQKIRLFILLYLTLAVNLVLYLIVKPTIYNGLRHYLFLTPIIYLVSFVAIVELVTYKNINSYVRRAVAVLWLIGLIYTGYVMYKLHPYEYLYFNTFFGHGLQGAKDKYELDYWGASYKDAFAWLDKTVPGSSQAKIYVCNNTYSASYYTKERFTLVNKSLDADYIFCDYDNYMKVGYNYPVVHQITRFTVPINLVLKVK